MRNVKKPIVAAGQVTDAGQGVWLSGEGGFILDRKSVKKVEKLLGDKKSFIELRKQKGVYAFPCEDPTSGLFPLIEKESDPRKVVDMSDVEVEGDRPSKAKSVPVLPTHSTFRSWCEACVAGRATEDAHRRSGKESSVLLVATDYGFLGRDTDADLATILVLAQRPHGAVGACQVLRKGPEPYAVDCVLAFLDSWGLVEVVPKADNEPAIQALVDGARAKRGEIEKSPKYWCQSNGAAENAVRRIESLTRTYVCVLQEKLGYKVDSKSIILP